MKISTQTIRSLNAQFDSAVDPAAAGVDVLVERIGAQLGAVEETIDFSAKYHGVVVARIVSCEDHPNADRLHVCMVDDGGVVQDVERDEQGYVQVVCGAPNARAGLTVAWLPPGSTVPESYDSDPFVLEARALRGVVSNGMLASPKELAISDEHDGILEIDEDINPGTSFVEASGLADDTIIDIENKMFTHRPDCFGWLGVARELAGIAQQPYKSPEWYTSGTPAIYEATSSTALPLELHNEIPAMVPRFIAVTLSDVKVGPSPLTLQMTLMKHGIRPINNVVDITNYMMLLTGQPMHAYDYDKVRAQDDSDVATIGARFARPEESIELLNGKTIEIRPEAIVITSDSRAIGLGGVMGGADTEVDANTKHIILECASFDMYSIRRTAMAHGIFTDAVTRFNKGQSPLQNKQVVEQAVALLIDLAGARFVALHDDNHTDSSVTEVKLDATFIHARLGIELPVDEIATILRNVEFDVKVDGEQLVVGVPFWRTDIAIAEDIVEEVGRLHGYDRLPLVLPQRSITPTSVDALLDTKQTTRAILAQAGANEVLTYSFVHGDLLDKVGQDKTQAFRLGNALSPDLQYYRFSITPSLLDKVHTNIKTGYDEFAIFEIGKGHATSEFDGDVPAEWTNIALTYAANDKAAASKSGAAYYHAQELLSYLCSELGIACTLRPVSGDPSSVSLALTLKVFDVTRTAEVVADGKPIGFVGEYHHKARQTMKLPRYAAGFEVSLEALMELRSRTPGYMQLSKFPKIEQDVTFKTSLDTTYAMLNDFVQRAVAENAPDDTNITVTPRDIYMAPNADTRNITLRLTVENYVRTMTDMEVQNIVQEIVAKAHDELGVEQV